MCRGRFHSKLPPHKLQANIDFASIAFNIEPCWINKVQQSSERKQILLRIGFSLDAMKSPIWLFACQGHWQMVIVVGWGEHAFTHHITCKQTMHTTWCERISYIYCPWWLLIHLHLTYFVQFGKTYMYKIVLYIVGKYWILELFLIGWKIWLPVSWQIVNPGIVSYRLENLASC